MNTNFTFNKEELEFMLITVLKTRNMLFDCIKLVLDKRTFKRKVNYNPTWEGQRGTIPGLEDVNKLLTLIRMHINAEETIALYEAAGTFDQPCKKRIPEVKS